MPERRGGFGRRAGEERGERRVLPESRAGGQRSDDPPKPAETRAEVEPNRRHFLHRKIGGKKKAAA